MDAIHGTAPSRGSTASHPFLGMKKGMIYSGTFMAILYGLRALWEIPPVRRLAEGVPVLPFVLFGALAYPLVKTIFETFDGSQGFFRRVLKSYRNPLLYARGAVVGLGLGLGLALTISGQSMATRVWFGFAIGLSTYAGVNALGDAFEASKGRGRLQSWKVYLVQGLLGGFIGAALGFYFDAVQVKVVVDKFQQYLSINVLGDDMKPRSFDVLTFLSRWGHIDLGTQTGGVKLLFDEALSGVIEWSTRGSGRRGRRCASGSRRRS